MSITRKEHKADIRKGVNIFRFIYIKLYIKFGHIYPLMNICLCILIQTVILRTETTFSEKFIYYTNIPHHDPKNINQKHWRHL